MSFRITQATGFHITFPNGWIASVQWGAGNYCDNYALSPFRVPEHITSNDAEVACWPKDREMVNLLNPDSYDTVEGYQSPAQVLAFLNLVASQPAR